MIETLKKPLLLILALMIVVPTGVLLPPKKASAIVVTGGWLDTVYSIPGVQAQLGHIQTSTERTADQTIFEWLQEFAVETLKKRLLDTLVDEIITWIQGGGTPLFVTDWQRFLSDAAGKAVGDFAQELGLDFLCQPFNAQIKIALAPEQRFRNQATCTLDDIVGNIENFYTDFKDGGWLAYQTAWEPQNNIFGSYLMAQEEQIRRAESARNAALAEAQAGNGFLSTKKCEKDINGNDIPSTCVITTPGSVIGDLASKAVGSDIDYIINATQLKEYVAAIANALINRLIREGVNGLRGVTSHTDQGSDFTPIDPADSCAGLVGSARTACQEYQNGIGQNTARARADILTNINAALGARKSARESMASEKTLLENYLAFLNAGNRPIGLSCDLTDTSELQDKISDLALRIAANDAVITILENAKTEVTAISNSQWLEHPELIHQYSGPDFSLADASQVKDDAKTEKDDIQNRINQCTNVL